MSMQRQDNKYKLKGLHLLKPACCVALTGRGEMKAQLLSLLFMFKVCGQMEGLKAMCRH